jgi:lipopolysaccharide/colanic/teichoic acid biosynthesis glycosyltransferase
MPPKSYLITKRIFDIVLAAAALLVLLPLFVPLIIILRLTGEGEVFYRQERVGYRGSKFSLLKFATMLKNSPNLGTRTITTKNDPRVLPLGRWLRKTKINELPQLINVLKGDMSIVGPRPQTEECYGYFPEKDRDRIYQAKPGLTGVGSVIFRDEEEILARSPKDFARCYREDIMAYKLALEIWYIEHQSFWLDLKLIFITVSVIAFPMSTVYRRWLKGLPLPGAVGQTTDIRGQRSEVRGPF